MTIKQKPEMHQWLIEPLATDVANSIAQLAEADDVQHWQSCQISIWPKMYVLVLPWQRSR